MRRRDKEISVSRLLELFDCPAQFLDSVRGRRDERSEFEVLGDATHKLAAGSTAQAARAFVERSMPKAPEAERERVLSKAVSMSEIAERTREPEVTPDAIERQLIWDFNGWRIYAKPDRIFFFDEVQSDGSTKRVLQITELKTAQRAKDWHWSQLFMFGTVATEVLRYYGPIKLVVVPLSLDGETPGEPEVRWYSQSFTWQTKQRILEALNDLERRWDEDDFPRMEGGHCFGCKLRNSCPVGSEYVARRLAEQAARREQQALQGERHIDEGNEPAELATTRGGESLPVVA
jgi:hypothetical protein